MLGGVLFEYNFKGVVQMSTQPRDIDIEERHVEKKSVSGYFLVRTTTRSL